MNEDEEEDEDVDRLMHDTDEKHYYGDPHAKSKESQNAERDNNVDMSQVVFAEQLITSSHINEEEEDGVSDGGHLSNSINLGPNLNLQVNAIGHVRRRKVLNNKYINTTAENGCLSDMRPPSTFNMDHEEEEGRLHFKMLHNSTVMPLKHSRYTNDD